MPLAREPANRFFEVRGHPGSEAGDYGDPVPGQWKLIVGALVFDRR